MEQKDGNTDYTPAIDDNLYHREGEARKSYIDALREADLGDYQALSKMILRELTPF